MESASSPQTIDWLQAIATHRNWLRKVLQSRIGDPHSIDDLMQEVALAVVQQSSNGSAAAVPSEPSKVAPFLYGVAVRKAANFHRKANRKSHAKPELNETLQSELTAPEPQPLDWLLKQEQSQSLESAIGSLDEESREILMLKYTENWSYKQLADRLGITEKAVERRLARARNRMRSSLQVLNIDPQDLPNVK
ncbi:RNA polymerase sigma factor [Mariniblastus fucicola]|nr:RNA polymerase sigma factor [Mariniblastus fucicola]